ncbi:MAG: hypothetical protein ACK5ND_02205 [Bacteroides sp.]
MNTALFYKEWIKVRWYFLLSVIATLGLSGYTMLRINRVVNHKGVEHVWEVMLQRDAIFIDLLQYMPLIVGLLMAIVQFVPEVQRKCLKLTLHLPQKEIRSVIMMMLVGLLLLLIEFASTFIFMDIYLDSILASELKWHILLTALPWYLAGIAAYFLIAWICFEPVWKMRVFNLVIALLILRVFFLSDAPEAYNKFLPYMGLYTLVIICFSWLSVLRFKSGKQD